MATFPLITKAQISARLADDSTFVIECMTIMQGRHEARIASLLPHGGWMASQAHQARQLAAKFLDGKPSSGDIGRARKLLGHYVKQIARHLRDEQLRDASPELREAARVFGVGLDAPATPATPAPTPQQTEQTPEAGKEEEPEPSLGRLGEDNAGAQDEQEQETAKAVVAALRDEPDLRCEEIASRIGVNMTTATLAPTLHDMVTNGQLEKSGIGRGTRYHLAG